MNFDRGVAINIIDHNGDIVKKIINYQGGIPG